MLVHRSSREAFVAALVKSLRTFYGEDSRQSADYGRIVNARHHERLASYLGDGKIAHGGEHDAKERFMAPTILTGFLPTPL